MSQPLRNLIDVFHPLALAGLPDLAGYGEPYGALPDIMRYLDCGKDTATATRIFASPPTVAAYLALMHEHVELSNLRDVLDRAVEAATPRRPSFRRVGATPNDQRDDPWAAAMAGPQYKERMPRADELARHCECKIASLFIRLFLGEQIASHTLVWTLRPASEESADWWPEEAREKFNDLVAVKRGGGERPRQEEIEKAAATRTMVEQLGPDAVRSFGDCSRLAYALWEARNRPPNDDWHDWLAAEKAVTASGQA